MKGSKKRISACFIIVIVNIKTVVLLADVLLQIMFMLF